MGKASSTKKVARVARTGGRQTSQKRQYGFPMVLGSVIIVGLALVAFTVASNRSVNANTAKPRSQGQGNASDHWHQAYGVDICGQFQPNLNDRAEDVNGIHTHGDGVIHVHPFKLKVAGPRATLGVFFDDTGLKVTSEGIKMPDGKVYKAGETTCNGQPGVVSVAHWKHALTAAAGKADKVYTSGFSGIKLSGNDGAFTVAFLPKNVPIAPPDTSKNLALLGACDGANPPAECKQAAQTGGPGGPKGAPTGATGSQPSTPSGPSSAPPASTPPASTPAGSTP